MPPATRTANVIRTVFWIVLSSVFLWNSGYGIAWNRAHGMHTRPLTWASAVIWCAALLFWLSVAWRDWTRRPR